MKKEKADYQQWIKEKTAKFIEDLELPAGDNKNIIASCILAARKKFIYLAQYEKPENVESLIEHIKLWALKPGFKAYSSYVRSIGNEYRKINKSYITYERIRAINFIKILLYCEPLYIDYLVTLDVPIDKSNGSVIFEKIAYHSSLLVEFIIATVQPLSEGVAKKYQTKLFSYTTRVRSFFII